MSFGVRLKDRDLALLGRADVLGQPVDVVALFAFAGTGLSIYGLIALAYLGSKLALAIRYRPARGAAPVVARVSVVVPFYNEDPDALEACLRSILAQTRRVDELFVVDDGSPDEACLRRALEVLEDAQVVAVVHRLDANCGKRRAQAWAFERLAGELVVTVDHRFGERHVDIVCRLDGAHLVLHPHHLVAQP